MSSAKFSFENGILKKKDYEEIVQHITNLGIPLDLNNYFKKKDINSIIKYMKLDKKNNYSNINLILIKKIGQIILNSEFNESKIKKYFNKELIN